MPESVWLIKNQTREGISKCWWLALVLLHTNGDTLEKPRYPPEIWVHPSWNAGLDEIVSEISFSLRTFSFKCSPFECQATAQLNVCIKCTYNLERQKKNFVESVWRKWNMLPSLSMKSTGLCRVGRDKRKWRLLWIVRGVSACSGCPSPEQHSQKPQVSWGPCSLCAGCTAIQSLILLVVFLKIVFLKTGGLNTGRPHHQYKRMFVVFNGMI